MNANSRDQSGLVQDFDQKGFIVVDRLINDSAVEEIAAVYDDILEGRIDCGNDDSNLGRITRQVMVPSKHHSLFRSNAALDEGRRIASDLLRCAKPLFFFDMLIYKPPQHPHATPWHQDLSYTGSPFAKPGSKMPRYASVQFWVALDDVDETTGCMHFIPGVQDEPLLPHRVASGALTESTRLLEIESVERHLDLSLAVACPLRRGGATGHGYGTPHYTSPNRSTSRRRRGYIFNYANPESLARWLPKEALAIALSGQQP